MDGMPGRTEAALFAVGVIVDDVDTGDAGHLVDRHMIVGDTAPVFLRETTALAGYGSRFPHTLHHVVGIVLGISLLIEAGSLTAHHIQENAIARFEV